MRSREAHRQREHDKRTSRHVKMARLTQDTKKLCLDQDFWSTRGYQALLVGTKINHAMSCHSLKKFVLILKYEKYIYNKKEILIFFKNRLIIYK